MFFAAIGIEPGTGAGKEVVEVADIEVEVWTACIFFSERVEIIVAPKTAPVAALKAATIAIVVFDMVEVVWGEGDNIVLRGMGCV